MSYFAPFFLALTLFLTPTHAAISNVEIYTIPGCMGCGMAKSFFEARGIPYQEISLQGRRDLYAEMKRRAGGSQEESMNVPQVFINGKHIGGYNDLSDDVLKSFSQTPSNG
jgi:glutaredoxin 3